MRFPVIDARSGLLVLALSCGCAGAPEIHLYTVDVSGAVAQRAPEGSGASAAVIESIDVRRVWGPDALELRNILFEEPGLEVGYYGQHRWVALPRELCEQAFVAVLREANVAQTVFSSHDLHASPIEVELEVERFQERDRGEGDERRAFGSVAVRLVGVDRRAKHERLFEHRAEREVLAAERSYEGVVRAINEALRQVLAELCAALQAELGR